MTKIILSGFAFMFALAGVIATNVSAASESIAPVSAGYFKACDKIGTCTNTNPSIMCVTLGETQLFTINSPSCRTELVGRFSPTI